MSKGKSKKYKQRKSKMKSSYKKVTNTPFTLHRRNLKTEGRINFFFVYTKPDENSVRNFTRLSFLKSFIHKMFSVHENERSTFSNSSCLKNIVEKLSLRDGLV